jgi:DNA-binding YbaB/EbfC family protein
MTIPGGDDLGGLLEGLGRLQRQLEDAQAAAADTEVVGSAGGDAVRIRAAGEFEFLSVEIDPATVPGADASLLEDLVLAALHDTVAKLQAAREAVVGAVVGDALGNLLGGGDLGNLGMFADIDEDDETDEEDSDDDEEDEDNGGDEGAPGGERPRTGE